MSYKYQQLYTLAELLGATASRTMATPPRESYGAFTRPGAWISHVPEDLRHLVESDKEPCDFEWHHDAVKFTDGSWLFCRANVGQYSEVTPDQFIRVCYTLVTEA